MWHLCSWGVPFPAWGLGGQPRSISEGRIPLACIGLSPAATGDLLVMKGRLLCLLSTRVGGEGCSGICTDVSAVGRWSGLCWKHRFCRRMA